jgi:hypothetical protein
MVDESVSTEHTLLDVIRQRAATVVQTKIAKNGGIYRVLRLWHLAAAAGMRIYPGNHPSTSVATAAVAHVCAAWPAPVMEGVFAVGVSGALATDIVTNHIVPKDGEVGCRPGPGSASSSTWSGSRRCASIGRRRSRVRPTAAMRTDRLELRPLSRAEALFAAFTPPPDPVSGYGFG